MLMAHCSFNWRDQPRNDSLLQSHEAGRRRSAEERNRDLGCNHRNRTIGECASSIAET